MVFSASSTTVNIFSVICGGGTFINSQYFLFKALRSKTGPQVNHGAPMKDFSGHFEMDLLPVFVNLVTSFQYLGEILDETQDKMGFFNTYRYATYCLTCPLMAYEIIYTLGAPYKVFTLVICLMSLVCALFADLADSPWDTWSWFIMGVWLSVIFGVLMNKAMRHAHRLNKGFCSSSESSLEMDAVLKSHGYASSEEFPQGILRIRTPMDDASIYIKLAFALMLVLWPVFPLLFVLEKQGISDRNATQVGFALLDLLVKSTHSYCLDIYKMALRQTVVSYGFLDTAVLYELQIWDEDRDIYSQLKDLSRSIYGDAMVGSKGLNPDAELDYQKMLIANRLNHNVEASNDKKPATSSSTIGHENGKPAENVERKISSTPTQNSLSLVSTPTPAMLMNRRGSLSRGMSSSSLGLSSPKNQNRLMGENNSNHQQQQQQQFQQFQQFQQSNQSMGENNSNHQQQQQQQFQQFLQQQQQQQHSNNVAAAFQQQQGSSNIKSNQVVPCLGPSNPGGQELRSPTSTLGTDNNQQYQWANKNNQSPTPTGANSPPGIWH